MSKPVAGVKNQDNLKVFGQKLHDIRVEAGLTQQELAEAVAYSPEHITKMERGLRLPSSNLLRTLVELYAGRGVRAESLTELKELFLLCKLGGVASKSAAPVMASPPPATAEAAEEDEDLLALDLTGDGSGSGQIMLDLKNNPAMLKLSHAKSHSAIFGRDAKIAELLRVLEQTGNSQPIAITGLGGIGKSSLAYEVAEQAVEAGRFERFIWESARTQVLHNGVIEKVTFPSPWLNFSASLTFEGLLDSLAFQLEQPDLLDTAISIEAKVQELTTRLQQRRYLLVLDNLETSHNPRLVFTYLTRMLGQSGSRLMLTSRRLPAYFEGYNLTLNALDPAAALAFLKHEGRVQNIDALDDESEEVAEALRQIVEYSGGHPLLLKLIIRQLKIFSLERIFEDLRSGYNERARLRQQPGGGLYTYIYKDSWDTLSKPSQRLLLKLKNSGEVLSESELLATFKTLLRPQEDVMAGMDFVLNELVSASLLEVRGGLLQKRYRLHPLTLNFLRTGLAEEWQLKGLRI